MAGDELVVLQGPGRGGPAAITDLPAPVQALAVCVAGEEAGQAAAVDDLAAAGLGGVIFFASALADPVAAARRTAALTALAGRSPSGLPLFLGADEEGGRVCRLPRGPATLPGAAALGLAGDPALAEEAGRATAGRLVALGLNWDLAPVCDLALADNPGLTGRAFGADPGQAAALAAAFTRGLGDGGVLACAKHFPGHGATGTDSHAGLPMLAVDEATLVVREAVPFVAAVGAGAPMVMLGHLRLAGGDGLPASLSPQAYRLARAILGPGVLLVTDALGMAGALAAAGDVGKAAVLALAAGADLLLVGHGPDAVYQAQAAILAALADGTLPAARLATAAGAVAAAKASWGLARRRPPDERGTEALLARPSDVALADRIAAASISELRPGPALTTCALLRWGAGTPQALIDAAARRWPGAERRPDGPGPGLELDGLTHLFVGRPHALPPAGRVLAACDAVPASLAALVAAAGRPLPPRRPGP